VGWRPAPQLDRSGLQVLTSLTISNGTGWSPDGTTKRFLAPAGAAGPGWLELV
jgi:hypothetical protein